MKIYLDMDDVLVDYAYNIAKHFKIELDDLYKQWPVGVYQIYHAVGLSDETVWLEVKSQPPEFWSTMPEFPWSRELWNLANSLGPTEILTSPVNSWTCVAGKVQWLHKWINEDFHGYHIAKPKWDCARWDKILIDDKEDNVDKFRKHGGKAILFPAHGNRLNAHKKDPMSVIVPQLHEAVKEVKDFEMKYGPCLGLEGF